MSLKTKADDILDLYGHSRSVAPFLLRRTLGYFFYITGRCNLNCNYCWQREMHGKYSENTKTNRNELSGDEWIKIIKSLPRFSFVGLTGGEPLLHPDFQRIIEFIGGKFPFTVNTNGILLTDEFICNFIEFGASNLSVSLDGFSDVHDISRNKNGLFDHIVRRLKRLNELKTQKRSGKPSLTIKMVLLDAVLNRLNEFYLFCDEVLRADCLNISLMKTTEHAQFDFRTYDNIADVQKIGSPTCYPYERSNEIPAALNNLFKISRNKRCKVLIYPRANTIEAIKLLFGRNGEEMFAPCYIPWSLLVILSNGTIIPCLSVNMGNIRELQYDIKQINASEKYLNFLKWRISMNRNGKSPGECNMCCFAKVSNKLRIN